MKTHTPVSRSAQSGMALFVSLVFLLLLTLIGISSMQNATLQEKMATSVKMRNQSFQVAESALRLGEMAVQAKTFNLQACNPTLSPYCVPPAESTSVAAAGGNSSSGVTWVSAGSGLYAIQNLGTSAGAVNLPSGTAATLYRVTGVGISGNSRTVVESIYAKY